MRNDAMAQDLARLATLANATPPSPDASTPSTPSRRKSRSAAANAKPAEAAPVLSDGIEAQAGCPDRADLTGSGDPAISDRPCFKVFTEWGERGPDGRPGRRPGVWFFGVKPGTDKAPPTYPEIHVCGPLWIEAVTTDAHGGNFGRLLNLRNTLGDWRAWAMPMELLAGTGEALRAELLSMGLELNLRARDSLVQYLTWETPARRVLCTLQTGWASPKFDAFVLPSRVIGPGADGVVFQGGRDGAEYATAGSLDNWRTTIAARAVGNPVLVLALCAAFAGPVLARCNAEGGGVHLVGDSSNGKTTAVEVAASVWGGDRFRRSWRATANGMEGAATLFNDPRNGSWRAAEADFVNAGARLR